MGWFFQILPLLVVFIVVASIIRTAAKVARKLNEPPPDRRSPAHFDPAEAERTRRIQEEIRRKIAERRGTAVLPEPALRDEPPEEQVFAPASGPAEPPPVAATAAILERQQQLADQMRALEAARLAEQRKVGEIATMAASGRVVASTTTVRGTLLADLRNPSTARRAMLLREVLGSPVALR